MRLRVEQIMSSPAETVAATAPASNAREAMRRNRIHHLVVMDGSRAVGVVSDGDLRGRDLDGLRVAHVMSEDLEVVSPKATVQELANRMRGHSIGCLPVVDGKRVVGMVTITDLLELIGKGVERPVVRAKRWTLKHVAHGLDTLRAMRRT